MKTSSKNCFKSITGALILLLASCENHSVPSNTVNEINPYFEFRGVVFQNDMLIPLDSSLSEIEINTLLHHLEKGGIDYALTKSGKLLIPKRYADLGTMHIYYEKLKSDLNSIHN